MSATSHALSIHKIQSFTLKFRLIAGKKWTDRYTNWLTDGRRDSGIIEGHLQMRGLYYRKYIDAYNVNYYIQH